MPKNKRKEDRSKEERNYKGVRKIADRFRARIYIHGKLKCVGTFDTPTQAAKAYDRVAIQAGRPTTKLNFPGRAPKNYQPMKKKLRSDNKIGFRGVHKDKNRFQAQIRIDGKIQHIGNFCTTKDAAVAYDLAAIQAKRPRSYLNFPDIW